MSTLDRTITLQSMPTLSSETTFTFYLRPIIRRLRISTSVACKRLSLHIVAGSGLPIFDRTLLNDKGQTDWDFVMPGEGMRTDLHAQLTGTVRADSPTQFSVAVEEVIAVNQ